jgi:hypothetical protein
VTCFFPFLLLNAQEESSEIPEAPDVVVLPEGKVIKGDYFVCGKSVEISGTVTGDVYVIGTQVFVDGDVQGDILAIAGSLEIAGNVGNNLRVIGGQVRITGTVGHNVSIVAANAELTQSAVIGGDIVCLTGNADVGSKIGYNATLVSSNLRVTGNIKNDLKAYAAHIRLTSKADIGGNFDYRSGTVAWIDPRATIGGTVRHHPTIFRDLLKGTWLQGILIGSRMAAVFMNFFFTFITGMMLLKLFPKTIPNAIHALSHHPWKGLFFGGILLIIFPLTGLLLLMTILGAPFALTVIALNVVTFYTVKIVSIMWASNAILPSIGFKSNKVPTFTLGLILYFMLTLIPYFGPALSALALLFGLGSIVLTQAKNPIFHPTKAT